MPLASVRKHWLLIILIVIGLLWWHIFDLLNPPLLNWNPSLTNVDYWSIITNPRLNDLASWGFVIIGIVIIILILRHFSIKFGFILIIVSSLLCTLSTCSSTKFSARSGRTIQHEMTIRYQSKVYHLALSYYFEFMDSDSSTYYVFECDISGNKCSKIFEEVGGPSYPATLVVSENKLIYHIDRYYIEILPEVNKSF